MEPTLNAPSPNRTLVTGGTGTLGSCVVTRLRDAGHEVRVLSRTVRANETGVEFVAGDLATGAGIDAALAGIRVIVHCAGSVKGDEAMTRNLVEAAARAGTRHLVYISVVGADRIPQVGAVDRLMFGFFGSKVAAERVVAESSVPWTTLRATQFQESTLVAVRQFARLPIVIVPAGFSFQPVAADEVAARLVELALGEPAGRVPDLGGPQPYPLADLARSYLRASNKHRLILPVRFPGKAAAAFRAGANLAPERAVGHRTWEEYLASEVNVSTTADRKLNSGA